MHFLALVLFFTFFAQTQADCDIGQDLGILLCYDIFFQAMGLPAIEDADFFPPFLLADAARRELLRKGPDYLPKVCSAATDLYECIDGAVQQDCIEMLLSFRHTYSLIKLDENI
ncbi:unnamed protein product, partial [Mesorhabditis belari]|uniref:Uncharacterized protein n=1 Tax=Mesorhabditis belari TaxID=2138241 RepID=A0AAF3EP49_9BILA